MRLSEEAFLEVLHVVGGEDVVLTEPKTAASSGVTAGNLLRHPDAHPIALDMLLLRQYGPDWLTWEGETIQHLVPQDFREQTLSDLNLAKVQACRTLHMVDTYWQRWEVFGWCTISFNSEFPDFDILQVPTVAQLLVSIDVAARIRDDVHFTDEVTAYMGAVFRHDDIFVPLPPADFLKLENANLPFDLGKVKERWPDVRATGQAPSGQSGEEEELRRLLLTHEYLEASRDRLRDQLRLIGHA